MGITKAVALPLLEKRLWRTRCGAQYSFTEATALSGWKGYKKCPPHCWAITVTPCSTG